LKDEWKAKAEDLERQLVSARTTNLATQEKQGYLDQIKGLADRNKVLEDEIRFVNYEQSSEFKSKYQDPYEKAFNNALEEMSELVVVDQNTGARRQVNAQDIVALCQLPLQDARALANDLYGDFADDMMAHRAEIKKTFKIRQDALKEARENGGKRMKDQQELAKTAFDTMTREIKTTWDAVNGRAMKDANYGKYLTPVEGDQNGNQRLAKGYEMVDRAFNEIPNNPNLTKEQRDAIIERHAVVRNRAAGFGRLRAWYEAAMKENDELKEELKQYRGSTPPAGGAPAPEPSANGGSARDRILGELRKKAR